MMYPKNIGLMMFTDKPEEFFYDARIDLVWFKSIEAESSDEFIEKRFTGPIYKQVYDVLEYLETNVLVEKVYKNPTKIESDRYFNYPSEALKEAVVNADEGLPERNTSTKYDMEYTSENGKYYVEVKAAISEFYMSSSEYEFANKKGIKHEIYLVDLSNSMIYGPKYISDFEKSKVPNDYKFTFVIK